MSSNNNVSRKSKLSAVKRKLLEKRVRGKFTRFKPKAQTIRPRLGQNRAAVSFSQQRLWFLDQLEPGSSAYNISGAVRLTGSLNFAALEQGLNEIVRRHEVLRTTFPIVDAQPIQLISPPKFSPLLVVDLTGVLESEQESKVQQMLNEEAQHPFDLSRGPLLRSTLLRLGEQEHVLLLTMHHIVSDGWSVSVFVRELAVLYEAFSTGKPSALPQLLIQYADFASWQRQWLQEQVLEAQLSYWKKQLAGSTTVLELPTDHARPAQQTFRGGHQSLLLPKSLSEALKALSRQENATLFMTLLSAFKILLARLSGQDDIIVGTPIANRNRVETEHLIGLFINTQVLRTDLSGDPTFRSLLGRVRQAALGAYAHQELPFEKLVEELQPERDMSRSPLFQVMFNMLNFGNNRLELPGLTVEMLSSPDPGAKVDLTLYAEEQNEGIYFELVYNADLFEHPRMVEMLEQLAHLLSQIVKKPDEKINRFSLVTYTAKSFLPNPVQVLRSEWKEAVHTCFSQQAHRFPTRLAVVDKEEAWSYQELHARSNQLANYLRVNGIHSQDIVAIYGHRSASLVWALLGLLKAGAAFVILDPAYPASRLINCLHMAKPRGWIQLEAAGALPDALEKSVAKSCRCRIELPATGTARGLLMDYSTEAPEVIVGPDDLAYIAFTSGTTGKPKGIWGEHRPLSHFLQWHSQTFGLNGSDRFSMLSGLSHDPLLRDIFTPLSLGATLYIPDSEYMRSPDWLVDWMKQAEISVAHLTPAMAQLLTKATVATASQSSQKSRLTSLRYAFFGGDLLTKLDVSRLQQLAPSITCVNFYGATETPQAMGHFIAPSLSHDGSAKSQSKEIMPVGQGIDNVQLLVCQGEQLAGIGELGEIYIRTPYLARGYLDDNALTQERFIINPFTGIANDRLYKSGDLGRYLPDGNVELLGRNDHQVKIRGFRIELREIEAVLSQHPAVHETVIMARQDIPAEGKRLVAYIVPKQDAPNISEVRRFLRGKLPQYMVPSTFMIMDALPLTPNGKVERRALPVPSRLRPELEVVRVVPRTQVEQSIATIWQQVLHLDQVGINDNFFDLGGHSLLLIQLQSKLQEALSQNISIIEIFKHPTISSLAEFLSQEQGHKKASFKRSHERAKKQKAAMRRRKQVVRSRRQTGNG